MEKIKVGVLGATGMVGQRYISLLENHPFFEVSYLAASEKSAGKKYADALKERGWHMDTAIPKGVESLVVENALDIDKAKNGCELVFSAMEMPKKEDLKKLEENYAAKMSVISNNSVNRWAEDIPMIIPEINSHHLDMIKYQKENRKWNGSLVVKPNCSIQSFLTPVYALIKEGYDIENIIVSTQQAVSGAGHPGVASLDMIDNMIPYINGEEFKTQEEPLKILGSFSEELGVVVNNDKIKISAICNRVPVIDGHMADVFVGFRERKPGLEKIINIWKNFKSVPQELKLPSAPEHPIIYRHEHDRPQPRKDRDAEKGMAVTVGRLEESNVLDIKFVGLSHNTIRGAAGGAILTAELMHELDYI